MNIPSNELLLLIQSLTRHEKRDFRLFSAKKSTYLKLFDIFSKAKNIQDKKITVQIKKNKIHNLKRIKSYLHKALLEFLEYRYANYSVEIQLHRLLQLAEVLYDKGLVNMAKKNIQKAEKLAKENHLYRHLLMVLDWKHKIAVAESDFSAINAYQRTNIVNELYAFDINLSEYKKTDLRVMFFLQTQSENPDQHTKAELKGLLKNPLLRDENKALSPPAKIIYWRMSGEIYFMLKNWKKSQYCFQYCLSRVDPGLLTPDLKLLLFSRLITVLRKLQNEQDLILVKNAASKFIESLSGKTQTNNFYNQYISLMINYISHHLTQLNIDEALTTNDEIQQLVEKRASTQNFMIYYTNRVILGILLSDYRAALDYANKVLFFPKTGVRQDAISFVKILSLLVHYELGNEQLLFHLCKSYAYYFKKQKNSSEAKTILLAFFGNTIHGLRKKESKKARQSRAQMFINLKTELEGCKTDSLFDFFDFISWVESKIENRPMIDVVKEKLK